MKLLSLDLLPACVKLSRIGFAGMHRTCFEPVVKLMALRE
jgi:hypothetical protein